MRTEPLRRALLLALLLASGGAAADWKREYDRGLKAIDDGDWTEAEARFAQALREDGTPAERKRFEGVRFNHYVPHYFAGLAAFRQGDCAKAVEYWSHAPTDAVLAKLADLRAEQQRGLGTCRTRLAQTAPATPPATTPASTPPSTPVTTTPATSTASTSRPPASTPAPATTTQRPVASTPPASTPATTRPPASTTPTTQPAAGGSAPAVLRSALEAYLAGRYADVQKVDASTAADARSRAQLHLLRAAAGYTVAYSNGDSEAALEAVRREVRAARAAQGNLSPDPVLFSPRFRSFWQQTR